MIVEFFLGLGLAGAIEAFINASIVLILRMAVAMILSILIFGLHGYCWVN